MAGIRKVARDAVDEYWRSKEEEFARRADEIITRKVNDGIHVLQDHVNKQAKQFQEECRGYIRDQAREEFLDVVNGVKVKLT